MEAVSVHMHLRHIRAENDNAFLRIWAYFYAVCVCRIQNVGDFVDTDPKLADVCNSEFNPAMRYTVLPYFRLN